MTHVLEFFLNCSKNHISYGLLSCLLLNVQFRVSLPLTWLGTGVKLDPAQLESHTHHLLPSSFLCVVGSENRES